MSSPNGTFCCCYSFDRFPLAFACSSVLPPVCVLCLLVCFRSRLFSERPPLCHLCFTLIVHNDGLYQTSLSERVQAKGGVFLEAPVSGSKGQAAGVSGVQISCCHLHV